MHDLSVIFLVRQHDHDACTDEFTHVVDELTYRCYAHNRDCRPDIAPVRWAVLFGSRAPLLELRYQADRLLVACGNRPTSWPEQRAGDWTEEDELLAAAEWTNNGPGYGEE